MLLPLEEDILKSKRQISEEWHTCHSLNMYH